MARRGNGPVPGPTPRGNPRVTTLFSPGSPFPGRSVKYDAPPSDPRLDERVVEVLTESAGRIAFNGLRRTLGAHPESLTRALKRLQRQGIVVREAGGYSLHPTVVAEGSGTADRPLDGLREIGSVAVPYGLGSEALLGHLSGRWFGDLRWVGVYEIGGASWLAWSNGPGPAQVFL